MGLQLSPLPSGGPDPGFGVVETRVAGLIHGPGRVSSALFVIPL
jgi:hypothetical protein